MTFVRLTLRGAEVRQLGWESFCCACAPARYIRKSLGRWSGEAFLPATTPQLFVAFDPLMDRDLLRPVRTLPNYLNLPASHSVLSCIPYHQGYSLSAPSLSSASWFVGLPRLTESTDRIAVRCVYCVLHIRHLIRLRTRFLGWIHFPSLRLLFPAIGRAVRQTAWYHAIQHHHPL